MKVDASFRRIENEFLRFKENFNRRTLQMTSIATNVFHLSLMFACKLLTQKKALFQEKIVCNQIGFSVLCDSFYFGVGALSALEWTTKIYLIWSEISFLSFLFLWIKHTIGMRNVFFILRVTRQKQKRMEKTKQKKSKKNKIPQSAKERNEWKNVCFW